MEGQRYKKILITGANSFLGSNVVMALCARGVEVRAIVRRSNEVLDKTSGCEVILGNLMEPDALRQAAKGCDAIVHIAAITDQSLLKYSDYRDFNVGALEGVITAARSEGIERVVFVSSSNTVGSGSASHPGNETTPLNALQLKQLYGRSKIEAEEVLFTQKDIQSVVVNPCFMIGPYDNKPSSGVLIMMGYNKSLVFTTPGGKNIVDVRCAAEAICNAVEVGRSGQKYILGGENMKLKDFFRLLAKIEGKKKSIITVPGWLLIAVGYVGDLIRGLGIRSQISSVNMRTIIRSEFYSAQKAESELGLKKTSVENCTRDAIEWFKSQGMVK